MRPGNVDTALFLVCCFLAAFEGWLVAQALVAAGSDALRLAQGFQLIVAAVLTLASATLAFRSSMKKLWQDRDDKRAEQSGIARAITARFQAVLYFAYELSYRTGMGAETIAGHPDMARLIANQWRDMATEATQALEYARQNFHRLHADDMRDIEAKSAEILGFVITAKGRTEVLAAVHDDAPRPETAEEIRIDCDESRETIARMMKRYPDVSIKAWEASAGESQTLEKHLKKD